MRLDEILDSHRTGRPVVMGILNVTPDSFSDAGQFFGPAAAIEQAQRMVCQGADIIDVGAESTRPGSEPVSADEQIRRLSPVLPQVVKLGAIVSIDTTSAAVAEYAVSSDATIINDISAGLDDTEMLPLAASLMAKAAAPPKYALVLMHMLGQPKIMQQDPQYVDVVGEVREFLAERLSAARSAGVPKECCIIDPGIGFGKKLEHNLALLANVDRLCELGVPVMVGPSRKRFIGAITGQQTPADRLAGSLAACVQAYAGGATIFRVHDVGPTVEALRVAQAIRMTK